MQQVQKQRKHRTRSEEDPAPWPVVPLPRRVRESCTEADIDEILAENTV
jgi:hypothetical protein